MELIQCSPSLVESKTTLPTLLKLLVGDVTKRKDNQKRNQRSHNNAEPNDFLVDVLIRLAAIAAIIDCVRMNNLAGGSRHSSSLC